MDILKYLICCVGVCVCVCLACHVSVLSCPHRQLWDQVLMFPAQTHKSPSINYSQTYLKHKASCLSGRQLWSQWLVLKVNKVYKCVYGAWRGFNQQKREGWGRLVQRLYISCNYSVSYIQYSSSSVQRWYISTNVTMVKNI